MAILFSLIILFSCLKKPMFGLALLLQINIIRALITIDYSNPCFNCPNEPDVLLGAITPVLGISLILLRMDAVKKIKYVFDLFDVFFVVTIITLFFSSFYAVNILESLIYSLKFLLLGFSFYFVAKVLMINSNSYVEYFKKFLLYSLNLAVFLGTIGGALYLFKGFGTLGVYRMTMPGVHPIPFSQLLGLGIFVSFVIFITNGTFFNIKSKIRLNINKGVLPYLVLLLLATNTRGIMLSVAVAILVYIVFARIKIKKRVLYISGGIIILAIIITIQYIDYEVLFERLLAKKTEKSVDDRFIAYSDSISIFLNNPFGIGPDAFKYYSILPYPHNIFLEFLSQYGIFGLFISIYFIFIIVYMMFITFKHKKSDLIYTLLFSLFFYFFIETIFSYTLWMHRGMYVFLGLFAGYHFRLKQRINLASNYK